MDGFNFTERVRKVLAHAREESARLHHEYVGTEHILLGLIREGGGVGFEVLEKLGDPAAIRETVEATLKRGRSDVKVGPDLPYTSRAKKVLELAMAEARELNHSYVGTEHLLLGLLREEKGIAAQVLVHHGVTLDRARAKTLDLLSSPETPGPVDRLPHRLTDASVPAHGRVNDVDPRSPYMVLLRYYTAFGERDMELMKELWSRSGRASRIAPDCELISGWPDVAESYRRLFARTSLLNIEVGDVTLSALGTLALVVSVEKWTIGRDIGTVRIGMNTTRVLRHEGPEWRLVHEHASAAGFDALQAYLALMNGG